MKILALDTSSPRISVAIVDGERILSKVEEIGNASTRLVPCIEKSLKEANLKLDQIEAYGIGEGPGSYNGLRCGFATLQGVLLNQARPVVQINSLLGMLPAGKNGGKFCGVILNARKQMYFFQKFETALGVPVMSEEGMRPSVKEIPGIDSSEGSWYSYEVDGMTPVYPEASEIARFAAIALKEPEFKKSLGEPRYLRPPV
jgi:tRNA threonylcarbamoyl adenosine modification protein YeaZ